MKVLLLVTLVASGICLTPSTRAEGGLKLSTDEARKSLHSVITQQMEAFRAGNYEAAYTYADETIKSAYSLEMFERMVQSGYAAIAHSVSATCGLTLDNGSDAVVSVRVQGSDEKTTEYQYRLHWNGKAWKISGVVASQSPALEV